MSSPSTSSLSSSFHSRRLKPRGGSGGGSSSLSTSSSMTTSPLMAATTTSSPTSGHDDDDPFSENSPRNNGDTDSAPSSTYRPTSPATNRYNRRSTNDTLSSFVSLLDDPLRGTVSSPRAMPSARSIPLTVDEPSPALVVPILNGGNTTVGIPPGSPLLVGPKLAMMPIEEEDKNADDTFGEFIYYFATLCSMLTGHYCDVFVEWSHRWSTSTIITTISSDDAATNI
jgi:hypothetical protein